MYLPAGGLFFYQFWNDSRIQSFTKGIFFTECRKLGKVILMNKLHFDN